MSQTLTELLAQTEVLCGHSVADDIIHLAETGAQLKEGWVTGTKALDSLLLARMVDENDLSYELEHTLLGFANTEPWKSETQPLLEKTGDMGQVPAEQRNRRCRLDAWSSRVIAEHYHAKLTDKLPLVTFTQRIASLLSRVTLAGAIVDLAAFERMGAGLETEMVTQRDVLTKAALAAGMTEFSPTNDDQLRDLLYVRLGLPILGRTKKARQPSVDKGTLKQLDHPVAATLLAYNKADKLYSVNVVGLRVLMSPCGTLEGTPVGYLPFRINPLGAKTGRRSSSNPNSQNWPPSVRGIVRSRWADGTIADIDYRKLEAVLFGWVAGDDKLFSFFHKGRGYIDVAKELFNVEVQEGTSEYKATKSIVLGVHYNMQGPKMAKNLWLMGVRFSADYDEHARITEKLRRRYLNQFRGIARYMAEREAELLSRGAVASLTGRVRHLPVPEGRDTPGFHRLLNQAINFPIQSLASDITGAAMLGAERDLVVLQWGGRYNDYLHALLDQRKKFLTSSPLGGIIASPVEHSQLINEVHDSLVVDLFPPTAKRDLEIFVENMKAVDFLRKLCPAFTMPLNVDVKTGPNWGMK